MGSSIDWCGYPYRGLKVQRVRRPDAGPLRDEVLVRDANAAMFNMAWDFFLPELSIPSRGFALDIGAGCGWASYLLSSHRRVVAIDIDRAMLAVICQDVGKGVRPIVADGRYLPFVDESLDFIFMNSGYHHIRDRLGAWDEWYRVLKPGGKLVATGESPLEDEAAVAALMEKYRAAGQQPDEMAYTKAELALALQNPKFTSLKYVRIKYQEKMQYMGSEELVIGDEEERLPGVSYNGVILAIK